MELDDSSLPSMFPILMRGFHNFHSFGPKSVKCPVCNAEHRYKPAEKTTFESSVANRCSHNARVVFCSFGCPVCLEEADAIEAPMVSGY